MASFWSGAAPHLLARHDTSSFTPAEKLEMLQDPYELTYRYGYAVICIIGGACLIAGLFNLLAAFRRTRLGARVASNKFTRRQTAAVRYVASMQPRPKGFVHFPTVGVIALLCAFWLLIAVWTFAQQPYYRSRWNVGSPPLAMRTGFFALGVFPFILMFGAKWSIVTYVTGYSHEKLQVFHQWLSQGFLVLSLLHTFPFVMAGREIRPNLDGKNPDGLSQIAFSWHVSHKVYYWSGTAMLVPLAWLCWGSIAPLRNRYYEMFKILHIISAILFSGFFYIHCNNLLFSWEFLWATLFVYGTSIVMRFGLLVVRNGSQIPQASVETLADNALRITVQCPPGHRWKAGQHYFLNFLKAAPFESHPYTIANAPYLHRNAQSPERTMLVLLRPWAGSSLAPRLAGLAASGAKTPVLLDGPYGGLTANGDLGIHDTVLLLAGGTGATFVTALLEDLCERIRRRDKSVQTTKVEVHWAVRNEEAKSWFEEQFDQAVAMVPEGMIQLNLYVTGGVRALAAPLEKRPAESEKTSGCCSDSSTASLIKPLAASWNVHQTRPCLHSLLTEKLAAVTPGSTVGIGSCGPVDFTTDVRRAVAARQLLIAKGKSEGAGAEEVELFTEEFSW